MKKILMLCLLFVLTGWTINLYAGGDMPMMPYGGSPNFLRLKTLVGTWEGLNKMHGGEEQKMTIEYSLSSNGSALVEKLFSGTPQEMISVYHEHKGKLTMTHYCMLGNQPDLDLISVKDNVMEFDLSESSDIDQAAEDHMHSLKVTFVDDNTIQQDWLDYKNGVAGEISTFKFSRVK